MIEGSMVWEIGGGTVELEPGMVAVVPRGVEHSGWTTGGTVRFYEAFAPARVQNLVGFLGQGLLPPNDRDRPETGTEGEA
jgi:homogentisate 1,2-dioxygenase